MAVVKVVELVGDSRQSWERRSRKPYVGRQNRAEHHRVEVLNWTDNVETAKSWARAIKVAFRRRPRAYSMTHTRSTLVGGRFATQEWEEYIRNAITYCNSRLRGGESFGLAGTLSVSSSASS